MRKRNLSP